MKYVYGYLSIWLYSHGEKKIVNNFGFQVLKFYSTGLDPRVKDVTIIHSLIYSILLYFFFIWTSQIYIEGKYYIEVLNETMDPVITDFHFSSLQQLRSNLREMEKLCGRVHSADAEALEKLVQPIRDRASAAIQEFLQIHSDAISRPDAPTISTHETISTASETLHSMCF